MTSSAGRLHRASRKRARAGASKLAGIVAAITALALGLGAAHAAPFAFITSAPISDGTVATRNGALAIIDTATRREAAGRIVVEALPNAVAAAGAAGRLYVVNEHNTGNGSLSVVSAVTGAVETTIAVGQSPHAVVVSPDEKRAYVANRGLGGSIASVSVVDLTANRVVEEIPIGGGFTALALSPDGRLLYVPNGDYIDVVRMVRKSGWPTWEARPSR